MDPKIFWLIAFVGIYWAYCLFWARILGRIAPWTLDDDEDATQT